MFAGKTVYPTKNRKLLDWVEDWVQLLAPDAVHWCDGSTVEADRLCSELVEAGTFRRLNDDLRPVSYTHLTLPTICSV